MGRQKKIKIGSDANLYLWSKEEESKEDTQNVSHRKLAGERLDSESAREWDSDELDSGSYFLWQCGQSSLYFR